jgi:hypothetical protein
VALAAWLVRLHFASAGPLLAALAFRQGFKWQAFATRNQLPFFALLTPWLGAIDYRLPAG